MAGIETTALVTGATGFIGSRLVEVLRERGCDPVLLVRPGREAPGFLGCRRVEADLGAQTPLAIPPGIDTVYHLAGKAHALSEVAQDDAEYARINTEGTRRMLEAAQRAGVRAFVFFSTVKACGGETAAGERGKGQGVWGESRKSKGEGPGGASVDGGPRTADGGRRTEDGERRAGGDFSFRAPAGRRDADAETVLGTGGASGGADRCPLTSVLFRPQDESCSSLPDTPYGQSKRAAERLVLEGGHVPHPVVLRPGLVYGPSPKGNLERMIAAVRRGRFPPLPEVGNRRSMVHVDDVVEAALLAAVQPAAAGKTYIVADGEPVSTRQMFEWICQAVGRPVPRWSVPLWILRGLGAVGDSIGRLRGRRFVFDSDAFEKLVGNAWYDPRRLQAELGWKPRHTLRESLPEICRMGGTS